ncbi:hypothetical protein [Butyrivibrio sp. INlla21]|uniref:hypothetical protein n=1 Tax=Butyrivibrio sp. INlla21 TaxID=1520811 RepID=UPI0008E3FBCC|nr:hypothetical protein [Butyrivibrio sp. INlla21]SFU40967.1 hypothetical protein SAMN02910342_00369 [Butyrivibrio sp. INlla21]
MADTNLTMPPFDDPKAAKAKLKADKKEYRKQLREQRKEQRVKEKEFADRAADLSGDDAGGLATLVITFLIVLIWLAIMCLLIKLNVGNFGSDILAPIIKDVPYLNLILPDEVLDKDDDVAVVSLPDSANVDISVEDADSITTPEQANAYIKRLEKALQDEMEQNSAYASEIDRLKTEVARLEPFEQQQKAFYEQRKQFYEEMVNGENAPSTETYTQWYETINPEDAERIYKEIKEGDLDEAAIKAFATTYSGMKAKQAAKIFDEMVAENQIQLVARILAQMSVENRGDILAQMEKPNAAKLTQLLEPGALEKKSTQVTG